MIRAFIIPAFLFLAPPTTAQTISGTASVIDGDTIEVHGARIRLHGVDSPEGRQSCDLNGKQWRCGTAAANALADRIARRPVTCEQQDVDRYGRIVAICDVGGDDLGGWMVRQGWALAYRHYSKAYIAAEDEARVKRRGLWVSEFQAPWDWRKAARSN